MCFLLSHQFPAHIFGYKDRYVLLFWTFKHRLENIWKWVKIYTFFFFFYPRCNAGRFLYGVPDSAWWSGALGVSSCHTCTWHKGISATPFTHRTAEEKHPLPQRSQTLCTGNCRAGCGPSPELLSPERWGRTLMKMLEVLYIEQFSASGWWKGRLRSRNNSGGLRVKMEEGTCKRATLSRFPSLSRASESKIVSYGGEMSPLCINCSNQSWPQLKC